MANPDAQKLKALLQNAKTIAVVGLSSDPAKDSYTIAQYLKNHGYRVIGVSPNPKLKAAWPDSVSKLAETSEPVDIVDLFLRPEAVEAAVDDAIRIGAKAVWMQMGVENEGAGTKAEKAGLIVVMNACIRTAHRMLLG